MEYRRRLHERVLTMDDQLDTPSLYSSSVFSPETSHFRSPMPNSGISTLNDLAVSMLDMDDDQRSSIHSGMYNSVNGSLDEDDDYADNDDVDDPRMSYLGPKMRYHSKAPWEVDSALQEEEEEEEATVESHSILSSSTTKRKPGIARHFPFGGSKSERSSEESTSSRNPVKVSLDSTSSQSSYSRDAYSKSSSPSASHTNSVNGGKSPFSLGGRSRPRSPSSPSHFSSTSPRSATSHLPETTVEYGQNTRARRSSDSFNMNPKSSFPYPADESHPYANPDFAFSSSSSDESTARYHVHRRQLPLSASRSDLSTIGPESSSYPPPSISAETVPSSPRLQNFKSQGKEISAPISVHIGSWKSGDVSLGNEGSFPPPNMPGWTERAPSPAFNLISLEEARAQRSRSKTAQHVPTSNGSVMASGSSVNLPFPDDPVNGQSPSANPSHRTRARSVSAGARAKQALNNIVGSTATKIERRDSEHSLTGSTTNGQPGGKALRNKKSGFLRLFNGAKDDKSPPPPVPSLSEGFAAFNAQQATGLKNTKLNSHRIPVPQISPSLLESTSHGSDEDYLSPPTARLAVSPKRTPPPPLSLHSSAYFPGSLRPPPMNEIPQSAPANVSHFAALKLRPVSSMFSASFGEHILPQSPEPETPSPTSAVSPLTPGMYSRPQDNFAVSNSAGDDQKSCEPEDQTVIIQRLQDQISRSKLAYQQQIWELEGQVRDLKAELGSVRGTGDQDDTSPWCDRCGRGKRSEEAQTQGVVNRPRARTGTGQSRFGSAM